jgi:hypothetical protein
MTEEVIQNMAADVKALKDMIPPTPPAADAINDAISPLTQTVVPTLTKVVVPVLTEVVAPTLLSVEARLDVLAGTYDALAAEVAVIRVEVARIVAFLAAK